MNLLSDPLIVYPSSIGLGLLLCGAAMHKLRDLTHFGTILRGYQMFPLRSIAFLVLLVPALEMLTGVALFVPVATQLAAMVATTLLLGYGVLLAVSLSRGTQIEDCGCSFGGAKNQTGPQNTTPLSRALIWRNLVLVLLGLNLEQGMTQRVLGAFDFAAIVFFTLIGAAMYSLANTLIRTQQSTRDFVS